MGNKGELKRRPPTDVLRKLRVEVGFRCPADDGGEPCGSPYLTWHHFDPPWRVEQHHRVEGMVALCQEHHKKADVGTYTRDQLRRFKEQGRTRAAEVQGRFGWMRQEYLAVVGGNAYMDVPVVLQVDGQPAVWFSENEFGEKLLNLRLPDVAGRGEVFIEENLWTVMPHDVRDVVCPPSGRTIRVDFVNGDRFEVEFKELATLQDLTKRYPWLAGAVSPEAFPLTLVELAERRDGGVVVLGPEGTSIGGGFVRHCFMKSCAVGVGLEGYAVRRQEDPFGKVLERFVEMYGPDGYKPPRT